MISMTIFTGYGLPISTLHEDLTAAKATWMDYDIERRRRYTAILREAGTNVAISRIGKTLISKR